MRAIAEVQHGEQRQHTPDKEGAHIGQPERLKGTLNAAYPSSQKVADEGHEQAW